MSDMQLVPEGKSHVELLAVKIADALLVAGQRLHARFAVMPEPADEFWEWAEQWRAALAAFITWSAPLDFSRNPTLRAGICSRTDYERCMWLLKKMGVVVAYPKSGHAWAHGWDKRKFLSALRRREVEAPYPLRWPVPTILHTRTLEAKSRQPSQARQLGNTVFFDSAPKGPELKDDRR